MLTTQFLILKQVDQALLGGGKAGHSYNTNYEN
jgi:hypothetical protein